MVRARVLRGEGEGAAEGGGGGGKVAGGFQGDGEVVVDVGFGGGEFGGAAVGGDGVVDAAGGLEGVAQVVVNAGGARWTARSRRAIAVGSAVRDHEDGGEVLQGLLVVGGGARRGWR